MSSLKSSVRLVAVCQKEEINSFDKRQIPINIDENLIMKLQLDDICLQCDPQRLNNTNKTYRTFLQAYEQLTIEELNEILCVSLSQIKEYIRHCVPCIGCRTSIENFIKLLIEYHHPGLEPLLMNEKGSITIKDLYISNPKYIYTLFYIHGSKLNSFIESIPKSKKNRRCNIHSLDKTRSMSDWELVWDMMNDECREELTLVEADGLLDTLENYLCKHKFCIECKLRVLEAYDLLIGDKDYKPQERKGFCPALYEGLRSCTNEKHIHVDPKKEFLSNLIFRAESEIHDNRRERHAKTLDIAQEEILTCIGIYLFERFDKIYRSLRSEEQTWQLLFYIAIDCLRLNFEKEIDRKQDFHMTLKILCEELCETDDVKTQKKQSKRSKRKSRSETKTNANKSHLFDKQTIQWKNSNENKQDEDLSYSSVCHYCLQRSNSLSIVSTNTPPVSLIKSQSCPTSLLFIPESILNSSHSDIEKQNLPISSSSETVFSLPSTKECVCHERHSKMQEVSCDECPTILPVLCSRCSSTRTDIGYSSGQDDMSSFSPCECSLITTCDTYLTELSNDCPLHEEDESGISLSPNHSELSSSSCSDHCQSCNIFINDEKTIELYDISQEHTLKLQLSDQYPFFKINLKQTWDDSSAINIENEVYISDADISQFSMLNKNFHSKRIQLHETLKLNFQLWKQRLAYQI
ncbi:hypothetical protein I4U23_018111 [Adineta vaga]|nr:hypothetical protein I4U23_018111 [Adineta vaga]